MKNAKILAFIMVMSIIVFSGISTAQILTPQEELGKFIYFDENLSTPPGQSCASCHHPDFGFADPDQNLPVSQGAIPIAFGNRNSPSAAYAAFSPDFHYDEIEELYIGGQFWDGRALNLAEQAKGPFLNPLEMHNPSERVVIFKIRRSDYADLFEEVYGPGALEDVETAYDQMAEAIAAFEETEELNKFSSKYDLYLLGLAELTDEELLGLELFNDEEAGNCAACHPSEPGPYADYALFTDFSYDNLGVPKNWDNPFLYMPSGLNPEGTDFIDYGLGAILELDEEMGKVKVPTLRNIAATPPYMHNGIFETLTEVVDFYNTRDVPGAGWPPPEVSENVNTDELGDLGLSDEEVDAIVAFMETLTDGYVAPPFIASNEGSAKSSLSSEDALNFKLVSNYPNPFNPTTTLSYELNETSEVILKVYDVSGREVATLVNGMRAAGTHEVIFDGTHLVSGVYLYQLNTGSQTAHGKMILMK